MKEHHIWCNFFTNPVEGCPLCEKLHKKYPMGELTPDELLKRHFPGVVRAESWEKEPK